MPQYVITPQNGDKEIFGVLHADGDHEAGLSVLRAVTGDTALASEIFFHQALGPACEIETEIEMAAHLEGAGWHELAPARPLPGGQPGGDFQDGDALARRWAMRRDDGNWATVTRWVYLTVPHGESRDSEERVIEVMSEFVACKDLHDIHGTEFFTYETFTGLPYPPTGENVRREAFLLLTGDIAWDGSEFSDDQAKGLIR